MSVIVSLRKVVEEMEIVNDEWTAYLNRRTGEFFTVTTDDLSAVEDSDDSDLPDWQRELLPKIREVTESADWLPPLKQHSDYRWMSQALLLGEEGVHPYAKDYFR